MTPVDPDEVVAVPDEAATVALEALVELLAATVVLPEGIGGPQTPRPKRRARTVMRQRRSKRPTMQPVLHPPEVSLALTFVSRLAYLSLPAL